MADPVIVQTFCRTRLGWRVKTERVGEGMATTVGRAAPFAFTRRGIERKALRVVGGLTRRRAKVFVVEYDEHGRRLPPRRTGLPVG